MEPPLEEQAQESLDTDITERKIQGIKDRYNSAGSEEKSSLLEQIAECAARKAQLEILDWVFSEGFQVPPDSLNNEFYHQVCFAQSIPVWKNLIKNGVNINGHHSEYFADALSIEAYEGNIEMIRFLLENGVDPNDGWGHGWTQKESSAHIAAAEIGKMQALKLLVEHGANLEEARGWWSNVGIVDSDKWGTALYRAAYKRQKEAVVYLLDKGASIHFEDEKERSIM
ncbi:hypothetical protein BO70DRAFT_399143 [Aspergillus heteromorphus CBS 117.55]|uniref:Uncharacterized protein n=1 Tax=Aspergillus heteromorphus CBS 117.55 TaxID=1448321 RepID=A0A317VGI2_9EURO|nr:uncharacterized protein BO70DRAFT_399143 [Aspergillus heteromorphus CBS 117.55]PWY72261.1 hypothetical protein BO70DRAFT_399143 [Aspergillus heteromorphus CBS 117.55]